MSEENPPAAPLDAKSLAGRRTIGVLIVVLLGAGVLISLVRTEIVRRRKEAEALYLKMQFAGVSVIYEDMEKETDRFKQSDPMPIPPRAGKADSDVVEAFVSSDVGVEYLRRFTRLRGVTLRDRVTDTGMARVLQLPQIRSLRIDGAKITDVGVARLGEATQIESLEFSDTLLTDRALASARGLPQLRWLHLVGARFTDAGLSHLEGMKQLQFLTLRKTSVAGDGLRHITGLPLESLDLEGSPALSDAAFEHLAKCRGIAWLSFLGTPVTTRGIGKIRQALPKCKVQYDKLRFDP